MKCSIDGCQREAKYRGKVLCQTHYHRIYRRGSIETLREEMIRLTGSSRKYRITMSGSGYQRLYEPNHPLRDGGGYVAEHRKVVYDILGDSLPPCEMCGAVIDWNSCHIDHIDRDVTNNAAANLRPLCCGCNTWRSYPEQHTIRNNLSITHAGRTMTPTEWSREPDVFVAGATIARRIRAGMTPEEALFAAKKTHKRTKAAAPKRSARSLADER